MQTNLINKNILRYFQVEKLGFYWSQRMEEFKMDIVESIADNRIIFLPGEIGAGKGELFEKAEDQLSTVTKFVRVRNYYKEHCTISSIINAAIYDLTEYKESPRRDLEARSRQFIRIVGSIVTDRDKPFGVCIVIEDAHSLHPLTIRALKELWETRFAGKSPLFSLVLIGWPEMMKKVRNDLLWRSEQVNLTEENGWMEYDERVKFLRKVFGDAITNDARKSIATICKSPLHLINYVGIKMKEAKRAGYKVIDSDVVQPTLQELVDAYKLTLGDIAKASDTFVKEGIIKKPLPRSTVFDAIKNYKHSRANDVRLVIEHLVKAKDFILGKAS